MYPSDNSALPTSLSLPMEAIMAEVSLIQSEDQLWRCQAEKYFKISVIKVVGKFETANPVAPTLTFPNEQLKFGKVMQTIVRRKGNLSKIIGTRMDRISSIYCLMKEKTAYEQTPSAY